MSKATQIPARILEALRALAAKGITVLREAWATEPTRVCWAGAAVIVFALAKLGIVVKQADVGEALLFVIPLLLGAIANRARVTPTLGARRRIVTEHEMKRTAEGELARLWKTQALAQNGDRASAAILAKLGITATSTLAVAHERKRRFKWAVVTV